MLSHPNAPCNPCRTGWEHMIDALLCVPDDKISFESMECRSAEHGAPLLAALCCMQEDIKHASIWQGILEALLCAHGCERSALWRVGLYTG